MRTLLSGLMVFILAVALAACSGGATTNTIPTSNPANGTSEPTLTPNPENADDVTAEATADNTAEATADMTAESTAEGTAESTAESARESTAEATAEGTAALETAFAIQITDGTDQNVSLNSDDGAEVSNTVSGVSTGEEGLAAGNTGTDAQASSSGQQVLNSPSSTLRTITFTNADDSVTFDLIFSDDLAPGKYQIGVNNVQTTVGNDINENSAGQSTTGTNAESTAEATSEASPAPAGATNGTAQAGGTTSSGTGNTSGQATQGATGSTNTQGGSQSAGNASQNNSDEAPSNSPQQGIVERDENFAPTIAARLETTDENLSGYNLVQGGTLTIDSMSETSASGSFEFTLATQDDPTKTITVSGTFTDIALEQSPQSTGGTSP